MPIVTVKVEIPDGSELADDTMRCPVEGESWLGNAGAVCGGSPTAWPGPRVILRRAWQWPPWLTKAAAIVKADWGPWLACERVPECNGRTWVNAGDVHSLSLTDFTPPPCTDWTESLRVNPNRKE